MTQIRLENISFGFSEPLFEDVTLTITDKDRIGVVGNNGTGKSTLLQCIAGILEPNKGRIVRPKGLKFGFMEQDIPENLRNMNLYDIISAAIPEEERDYNSWKVDVALDTFKAPNSLREKPIHELSGGWQRLALIARIGLSEPDILLLDEPTNHLDVAKILVLEQWLNEQIYSIPLITISHDRSFLENCTNKTIFLRGTEAHEYDYSYSKAKELLFEDDKTAAAQRSKEIKQMDRLKRSAHELRQIGVNNYSDSALKKSAQIAQRAEAISSSLTQVHVEERRDIKLSSSSTHAKKLIGIKNVTIQAPNGNKLFHIDNLDIMQGDRLVIMGPNGSGKSQFLHHLHRSFRDIDSAREGRIIITPSIKLGYLDQHLSHLPLNRTLREYFMHEYDLGDQRTTSTLIGAGFPISAHNTKLSSFSHGQRARIALVGLRLTNPNFYIMDEPTNHLDIVGQEQLETEILEQQAASILVSHDRAFVENIGTKFYAINNNRLIAIDGPEIFYNAILQNLDSANPANKLDLGKKKPFPEPA